MFKKIMLTLIGMVVLIVISGFAYVSANKSPQLFEKSVAGLYYQGERSLDQNSRVLPPAGEIIGFADSYDTFAWTGIPYAKPPVGELRWRATQSLAPFSSAFEANDYSQPCMQFWGGLAGVEGENGDVVGREDCLSLNIWSPKSVVAKKAEKKLPVMVWIHGGGNDSGTGSIFQGHHLAGTKDVVVVTINYRVGLLGWFSHDAIRATSTNPEDASGNFGTLDIIQSLKWVQKNIDAFGGDANNVTIFGESAGGRNVYSMLASPLAKGLFHKAISQSGTPDTTVLTLAEEYPDNKLVDPVSGLKNSSNGLISLLISDLEPELSQDEVRAKIANTGSHELMSLLRSSSPEKMMRLATKNSGNIGYIQIARVLRDGYVLPKASTLDLFSSPQNYNSVPLMLGTNRDEQKLFMARNPRYVDWKFGVLPNIKDVDYYNRVSEYVSNTWKAGAVDEPAKLISETDASPVFAYRFDWDESPSSLLADLPTLIGAAHGVEINFVFGDFEGGVDLGPLADKANAVGRKELSLTMMDYWANFAHTGLPGKGYSGEQVQWSAWSKTGNNVMLLDTNADGGSRMAEVRDNIADIKSKIPSDALLVSQKDRCEAYAILFLHGYQSSDFWNEQEYSQLGCDAFPAGQFRNG